MKDKPQTLKSDTFGFLSGDNLNVIHAIYRVIIPLSTWGL